MSPEDFDNGGWIERVPAALVALARAQGPYLEEYWRHKPPKRTIIDGRDESPFPLDDVRDLYAEVRYSKVFDKEAHYAPLCAVIDPVRHALLSHPALERVAVTGRTVGENDFWMRILNSGASISASDLIAGLMARGAEMPGDRFRTATRELDAFLSPARGPWMSRLRWNACTNCRRVSRGSWRTGRPAFSAPMRKTGKGCSRSPGGSMRPVRRSFTAGRKLRFGMERPSSRVSTLPGSVT